MAIIHNSNQAAKILRTIAMAVISISGTLWLFQGLVSGLNKGLGPGGVLFHLLPGLINLAGAAIAWQWGLIGGIILIILGLFDFFLYLSSLGLELLAFIYALPSGLPLLLAGCLFIISWWKVKKVNLYKTTHNNRLKA